MKKILILSLFILIIVTAAVSGEDVVWGSFYEQNNLRLGIDANLESNGIDWYFGISPEAEILLWKPVIGNTAFIDAGAALRGRIGLPLSGNNLTAGAGILGTMHIGFRGLNLPVSEYLGRIDVFAEAGLKFDFLKDSSFFGLAVKSGVNYFINDQMSAGIHYSTWGEYSGAGLSFSFKPGTPPEVKSVDLDFTDEITGFAVEPYLLQFYTIYYSAHFAGGFYPESFVEGQGCAYRVSIMDETGVSSYIVEKAYLGAVGAAGRLWSLILDDGEDSFYYEYLTDEDNYIRTVYYKTDDGEVLVLNTGNVSNSEPDYNEWQDYAVDVQKNVRIDVEAGRFDTTEYMYVDMNEKDIRWWISSDVPGELVSYKMEDNSDIVTTELIDISSRNKARLYR